jgi:hypothetical protein
LIRINNRKKGVNPMKKELILNEAKDFFNEAKKQIREIGLIESVSILFCEKNGSIKGLIVPGQLILEESNNKNRKQDDFDLVVKLAKRLDAVAIIQIEQVWAREKPIVDNEKSKVVNPLPPSRDPNRMEALMMVISMPGFSIVIMQPYRQIGGRIVFGEEVSGELNELTGSEAYKCLVDLWESDDDLGKEIDCTLRSMKNLQS